MSSYKESLKKVNWYDKAFHLIVVVAPLMVAGLVGFHNLASYWEDTRDGIENISVKVGEIGYAQQALTVRVRDLDGLSEYTINHETTIHEVAANLGIPPQTLKLVNNLHIPDFSKLEHGAVIIYNPADEGSWP